MELTPGLVFLGAFIFLSVAGAGYYIVRLAVRDALRDHDREQREQREQQRQRGRR